VYRDAWTHEDALALLHKDTGTAFDERCVAALERVLTRDEEGRVVRLPTSVPSVHPSAAAAS
jgi:HD-GYP domain-containing protein (c-di-GMP phosphodiesterase class II)